MSILTPQITVQQDQYGQPLADVTERGSAIYKSRFKALLEPDHLGEVVAIHVDTGEYAVAASSPNALRAVRRLQPSGLISQSHSRLSSEVSLEILLLEFYFWKSWRLRCQARLEPAVQFSLPSWSLKNDRVRSKQRGNSSDYVII